MYHVDQNGISVVQYKRFKIISMKGEKQAGPLTSFETGKLITVVTRMTASGSYVPSLVIFPGKNMS